MCSSTQGRNGVLRASLMELETYLWIWAHMLHFAVSLLISVPSPMQCIIFFLESHVNSNIESRIFGLIVFGIS